MKKMVMALILVLAVGLLTIAGCGDNKKVEEPVKYKQCGDLNTEQGESCIGMALIICDDAKGYLIEDGSKIDVVIGGKNDDNCHMNMLMEDTLMLGCNLPTSEITSIGEIFESRPDLLVKYCSGPLLNAVIEG